MVVKDPPGHEIMLELKVRQQQAVVDLLKSEYLSNLSLFITDTQIKASIFLGTYCNGNGQYSLMKSTKEYGIRWFIYCFV